VSQLQLLDTWVYAGGRTCGSSRMVTPFGVLRTDGSRVNSMWKVYGDVWPASDPLACANHTCKPPVSSHSVTSGHAGHYPACGSSRMVTPFGVLRTDGSRVNSMWQVYGDVWPASDPLACANHTCKPPVSSHSVTSGHAGHYPACGSSRMVTPFGVLRTDGSRVNSMWKVYGDVWPAYDPLACANHTCKPPVSSHSVTSGHAGHYPACG
jgi:hypothetical protein